METEQPWHVHVTPMAVEDGCSICGILWVLGMLLGGYGACYGQVTIVVVLFPALIGAGGLACCSSEWFPQAPFSGATATSAVLFAFGHLLLVCLGFVAIPLLFALVRAHAKYGFEFAMVPDGMSFALVPLGAGVVSMCMYRQWQTRTRCDRLLAHH